MKVDITAIYAIAFLVVFVFQNFFTVTKQIYEVSGFISGEPFHDTFISKDHNLRWIDFKGKLETDPNKTDVVVMVVAKRESIRTIEPFWAKDEVSK